MAGLRGAYLGRDTDVNDQRVLGGRYRLEQQIGAGGMSVVWRAHDELLGRPVAVKVLSGGYRAAASPSDAILAEAQAAARLRHPNVTNVYDYGESTGEDGSRVPYVVMELLCGLSLADRLMSGPLPPNMALRVCAEVAAALAAAHENNVVHRDVKPGNIMLTSTGAKVFDFGIAAPAGQPDATDPAGRIMGTPAYVAPERLLGGTVVPETDVYSLGLLLFRLLTGEQGRPPDDAFADPAPLPPVAGVPPEVAAVYEACVDTDPRRRPTAGEAAAFLAAAAGVPLPVGPAPRSAAPPALDEDTEQTLATRPPMRRRTAQGLGFAMAVGVMALLLLVIVDLPPPPASLPYRDTGVPGETFGAAATRPADPAPAGDSRRRGVESEGGTLGAVCAGCHVVNGTDRGQGRTAKAEIRDGKRKVKLGGPGVRAVSSSGQSAKTMMVRTITTSSGRPRRSR